MSKIVLTLFFESDFLMVFSPPFCPPTSSPNFIYFHQLTQLHLFPPIHPTSGCLKIESKINKTPRGPQNDTRQHGNDDRVDVMVE